MTFTQYLEIVHARDNQVLSDDDMWEDFPEWVSELDSALLDEYADQWMAIEKENEEFKRIT